jgi:anthraniloyl-CoA monooxygenase
VVKGYVEQPVAQASSDYRYTFADSGHTRSIGLGDAAVLRRYGDGAEAAFDVADLPSMVAFAQDAVGACAGDEAGAAQRLEQAGQARALANQHGARNLADWFSHAGRYRHLPLAQFAYSMLSASQRVGHDELARLFPSLVRQVETGLAGNDPVPPMFAPFALRGMTLVNRVVVSPMCMYSASEGMPDDFHLVHLGARALGGAGLVISEMTAVSQEGRITPGCAGIYTDAQAAAWQRIVAFVHRASSARIGLQLGHAGPKASTQLGWQRMDAPLKEGNWPIVAASDLAYGPDNQIPKPLDEADMARIEQAYVHAARRAIGCGFDMLELHAAHGYLLSSFISPLTNRRADQYGGSLDNRLRFPLRVFGSIRKAWPQDKPITVRISAHDWAEGGTTGDDAMAIAAAFKAAGADAISVSTGQTTRQAKPLYGRMYQVPFADRIRNEVGIPTIAVGAITDADQVNSIIAAGRADLCALARPHLADPHWTLHAAVDQGVKQQAWPKQYIAGRFQAERELGKRARPGAGA